MGASVKPVNQTRFYEGLEERGSCVQACVASIFELPESLAPIERDIYTWTSLHYPGLQYVRLDHEPQPSPSVPVGHHGFWIASVHTQTEGFTDNCGRCWEFEGNENGPPLCDPPRPCPFCGEPFGLPKGTRPGYHAIVMRNAKVEHDPNPHCDWDAARIYIGAAWRAAKGLGYRKLITYTLASESGASLRASGWRIVAQVSGQKWDAPGRNRPRVDLHPTTPKLRWEVA